MSAKAYFSSSRELAIPREVKRMLRESNKSIDSSTTSLLVRFLRSFVPTFNDYPHRVQKLIVSTGEYIEFKPSEYVLHQGDPPGKLYFIINGTVVLSETRNDQDTNIRSVLGRGGYFGDEAIMRNSVQPLSAQCQGVDTTSLLALSAQVFTSMRSFTQEVNDLDFLKKNAKLLIEAGYPFDVLDSLNKHRDVPVFHTVYFKPSK